jgi:Tol biopolymer transport system component
VYRSPRLSPDQKHVVMSVVDPRTYSPDLWILELARGTVSRLTTNPRNDWFPAWSPDGSRVIFGSTRDGSTSIFRRAPTGDGQDERVMEPAAAGRYPNDVGSDGLILYQQVTQDGYDLGVVQTSGERTPRALLATPFNEVQGRLSPNMRWVAYASDESGRFEVYVRPFPTGRGKRLISVSGGMQPEWSRDGRELFYLSGDGKLTAVTVTTDGSTFEAGVPRTLFDVETPEAIAPFPTDYAATDDAQRFLVNTVVDQPARPAVTVVLNWTARLKP